MDREARIPILNTPVQIDPGFLVSTSELETRGKASALDFILSFQRSPAHPSHKLERLKKASQGVWSARMGRGLRAILFQGDGFWTLLYGGTHKKAYRWAENRKIEEAPDMGILVTEKVAVMVEAEVEADPKGLLDRFEDAYLLSLGIPETWLPAIRCIQTEDELCGLELPSPLMDKLVALAVGEIAAPRAWPPLYFSRMTVLEQSECILSYIEDISATGERARAGRNQHGTVGVTTADIARNLGLGARTVMQRVQVARLPADVKDLVRGSGLENSTRKLLRLVREDDPRGLLNLFIGEEARPQG